MKIIDPKKPFKYTDGKTPSTYRCGKCGAKGVKLWREYNTFLDHQHLFCYVCAGKNQKTKNVLQIDDKGKIPWFYNGSPMGRTDQIGSLIPAVPTEQNDTYWGYTSVPAAGCVWWVNLPNKATKPVRVTLTAEEAMTLAVIHGMIGGDPKGTRGHMDRIFHKLTKHGDKWYGAKVNSETNPDLSAIYFKP